jgi:hypothetical protein
MVLASPGPLLTPPPSSSPPKTPFQSYSATTPPCYGNQTPPSPVSIGSSRQGLSMEGQNWPQADTDVPRHPRHIATVLRQSTDYTTANQTTTSHHWCGRAGPESHDSKARDNEGSPRVQPPDHRHRQLTMHISTNDLHCCKPPHLLQLAPSRGHPRLRPPATAPPWLLFFVSARTSKRHHHHHA